MGGIQSEMASLWSPTSIWLLLGQQGPAGARGLSQAGPGPCPTGHSVPRTLVTFWREAFVRQGIIISSLFPFL